jgi:hypothetical protein
MKINIRKFGIVCFTIFVIGCILALSLMLSLALTSCGPARSQTVVVNDNTTQQQVDPNDDQYYAQQAYSQWQQQNTNRDFNYFLMYIWANQLLRSNYYSSFHVYSYSPPVTVYHYYYRPSYQPIYIVKNNSVPNKSFSYNSKPNTSSFTNKSFGSSSKSFSTPKSSFGSSRSSFGSSRSSFSSHSFSHR